MGSFGIAAYLFGMAAGYWVLTLAAKEKGRNQLIGKVIGWVIIVVAAGGILCKTGYCITHCRPGYSMGDRCGMGPGGKYHCEGMMGMPDAGAMKKDGSK